MECPDSSKLPGPIAALFHEGGHDQTPEWAAERIGVSPNGGLLVKAGANDYEVLQASAASDLILGVCVQPGAVASGDRCSVVMEGVANVTLGGSVTRGNEITADANGKGVAAAPGGGANNRIVGVALQSGVAGDSIEVLVAPGLKQG
jgi:hypothetical protein